MYNDLSVFDSKHYNGRGKDWDKSDTVLAASMAAVPLFFVVLALTFILPHLIWVAWPALAIGTGQVMKNGIKTHRYYGLTDSQIDTVKAIESLPEDVRSRYGDNYIEHVRAIGTGQQAKDLSFEVQRLADKQRKVEENRREHEMAPIAEALRETTREIAVDLGKMDPGPLQLTSGKSKSSPLVDEDAWGNKNDYGYSSRRY